MFSVSPEIYKVLYQASRYLFAFFALMLLLFSLSWLIYERKKRRERFRSLPEAGNIGELVVISGNAQLPADTWFPVPREGVLGSLRSCDLVVPCPGVRAKHLSFFWQDGSGLVLRPFSGCDAFVDGVSLLTADKSEIPVMVHGSCLQVGSTFLRLQLLSALEHTNRPFAFAGQEGEYSGQAAAQQPLPYAPFPQGAEPPFSGIPAGDVPAASFPFPQDAEPPLTGNPAGDIPAASFPLPQAAEAAPTGYSSEQLQAPAPEEYAGRQAPPAVPEAVADAPAPESDHPVQQAAPRRRRADRWKEDFSE